jgi:hypothetical protein
MPGNPATDSGYGAAMIGRTEHHQPAGPIRQIHLHECAPGHDSAHAMGDDMDWPTRSLFLRAIQFVPQLRGVRCDALLKTRVLPVDDIEPCAREPMAQDSRHEARAAESVQDEHQLVSSNIGLR